MELKEIKEGVYLLGRIKDTDYIQTLVLGDSGYAIVGYSDYLFYERFGFCVELGEDRLKSTDLAFYIEEYANILSLQKKEYESFEELELTYVFRTKDWVNEISKEAVVYKNKALGIYVTESKVFAQKGTLRRVTVSELGEDLCKRCETTLYGTKEVENCKGIRCEETYNKYKEELSTKECLE